MYLLILKYVILDNFTMIIHLHKSKLNSRNSNFSVSCYLNLTYLFQFHLKFALFFLKNNFKNVCVSGGGEDKLVAFWKGSIVNVWSFRSLIVHDKKICKILCKVSSIPLFPTECY